MSEYTNTVDTNANFINNNLLIKICYKNIVDIAFFADECQFCLKLDSPLIQLNLIKTNLTLIDFIKFIYLIS